MNVYLFLPTRKYIMSASAGRPNDMTISASVCICMKHNHLMTVPHIILNGQQNLFLFLKNPPNRHYDNVEIDKLTLHYFDNAID